MVSVRNPTSAPLKGWRGYGGEDPKNCVLNGTWKLIFTDAADATFKKSKRGSAKTFQEIDAEEGWFINCVDFSNPDSKLQGFRVFVEGKALNDSEVELIFRKVRLLRRSRFFPEITIPLPGRDTTFGSCQMGRLHKIPEPELHCSLVCNYRVVM